MLLVAMEEVVDGELLQHEHHAAAPVGVRVRLPLEEGQRLQEEASRLGHRV